MTDDGGARSDFWTIAGDLIYLFHVEPRVKLFVPKEDHSQLYFNTLTLSRMVGGYNGCVAGTPY